MSENVLSFIIALLMISTLFMIVSAIVEQQNDKAVNQTFEKCCDGHSCTDTYYDEENDRCIMTLCPGLIMGSKCYYDAE